MKYRRERYKGPELEIKDVFSSSGRRIDPRRRSRGEELGRGGQLGRVGLCLWWRRLGEFLF